MAIVFIDEILRMVYEGYHRSFSQVCRYRLDFVLNVCPQSLKGLGPIKVNIWLKKPYKNNHTVSNLVTAQATQHLFAWKLTKQKTSFAENLSGVSCCSVLLKTNICYTNTVFYGWLQKIFKQEPTIRKLTLAHHIVSFFLVVFHGVHVDLSHTNIENFLNLSIHWNPFNNKRPFSGTVWMICSHKKRQILQSRSLSCCTATIL